MTKCEWCLNPDSTNDEPDTEELCTDHLAEYEGLSVYQMERRDREQYAEWLDATHDEWLRYVGR